MHTTAEELKTIVRDKYAQIALQDKEMNQASCCGAGGCSTEVYNIMTDDYTAVEGYLPEADLGLGCGLPTASAQMKAGDTVVDLGSGAGNDAFVARAIAGPDGRVIGIDFTPEMIEKARANARERGFDNVEFRQGDIEHIPMTANMADVVVSNCVLNLVPNKPAVFAEMFRILKPGGHFSISDIVIVGELPEALQKSAEMYAGCVSGAIQEAEYLNAIAQAGFVNIQLHKRKPIIIPNDILSQYLTEAEIEQYAAQGLGIFSITVYGEKPSAACCIPGQSTCC
jgi:arsenite methyltransferase